MLPVQGDCFGPGQVQRVLPQCGGQLPCGDQLEEPRSRTRRSVSSFSSEAALVTTFDRHIRPQNKQLCL